MTIVRHWTSGFSLFLHHKIRKNQVEILSQKCNCPVDLQILLIINLSRKKGSFVFDLITAQSTIESQKYTNFSYYLLWECKNPNVEKKSTN